MSCSYLSFQSALSRIFHTNPILSSLVFFPSSIWLGLPSSFSLSCLLCSKTQSPSRGFFAYPLGTLTSPCSVLYSKSDSKWRSQTSFRSAFHGNSTASSVRVRSGSRRWGDAETGIELLYCARCSSHQAQRTSFVRSFDATSIEPQRALWRTKLKNMLFHFSPSRCGPTLSSSIHGALAGPSRIPGACGLPPSPTDDFGRDSRERLRMCALLGLSVPASRDA
mmetsp:Transcript_24160/g.57297  ORF Transcript_24160/g.57297 Transcript_24160/m.57297 type:complete len:222 (-) Transcript_24160:84-749(-)